MNLKNEPLLNISKPELTGDNSNNAKEKETNMDKKDVEQEKSDEYHLDKETEKNILSELDQSEIMIQRLEEEWAAGLTGKALKLIKKEIESIVVGEGESRKINLNHHLADMNEAEKLIKQGDIAKANDFAHTLFEFLRNNPYHFSEDIATQEMIMNTYWLLKRYIDAEYKYIEFQDPQANPEKMIERIEIYLALVTKLNNSTKLAEEKEFCKTKGGEEWLEDIENLKKRISEVNEYKILSFFSDTKDFEWNAQQYPEKAEEWMKLVFEKDSRYSGKPKWLEDRQRTLLEIFCQSKDKEGAERIILATKDLHSRIKRISKYETFFGPWPNEQPTIAYDEKPTNKPVKDSSSFKDALKQRRFDDCKIWLDVLKRDGYKNLPKEHVELIIFDRKKELDDAIKATGSK